MNFNPADPEAWDKEAEALPKPEPQKPFEPPFDRKELTELRSRMGIELNQWYTTFAWLPARMDVTGRLVWLYKISVRWQEKTTRIRDEGNVIEWAREVRPYHPNVGNFIFLGMNARYYLRNITWFVLAAAGFASLLIWLISMCDCSKPENTLPKTTAAESCSIL